MDVEFSSVAGRAVFVSGFCPLACMWRGMVVMECIVIILEEITLLGWGHHHK